MLVDETGFNQVLADAEATNKALVIYFDKQGDNNEMSGKFNIACGQNANANCIFAKADVNSDNFFWTLLNGIMLPQIQSYVKKVKIMELVGPTDEINYLITFAIKAL